MKRIAFSLFILVLFAACKKTQTNSVPEGFKAKVMLRMTPIKDQGQSELCWAFAMLATIETEHLEQEDSVNLSTDFVARKILEEQALERFDSQGEADFSMRGIGPMLVKIIRTYGIMPHDSYYSTEPINYKVLQNKVEKYTDLAIKKHESKEKFSEELCSFLDREIGALPLHVYMLGSEYTPLEFAHSVCLKDEYQACVTLDDEPYYKEIDPQLTDNRYNQKAFNVPANKLTNLIIKSLKAHHPVFWEGGENDNHAVALIGMGQDKDGVKYFVGKNSWGKDNETHGLMYLQVDYVYTHTALVMLHKEFLD